MKRLLLTLTFFLLIIITSFADDTKSQYFASLEISAPDSVSAGSEFIASIILTDSSSTIGGFNLLIEYDFGALVFDSANFGSLTDGEWEFFSARDGFSNTDNEEDLLAYIRLVAIANSFEKEKTPKPESMRGPGELTKIKFYVTERKEYQDTETYLRFIWTKCDDNSFSTPDGNKLLLSNRLFDYKGEELKDKSLKYNGSPDNCFRSSINPPVRAIDFQNAKVIIK